VDFIVNSIPHYFGHDSNTTYWLDYNVIIQNIGNLPYSGQVSLSITRSYDINGGGHYSQSYSTNCSVALLPMATKSCWHSYQRYLPAASYRIGAYADSNHAIPELNENNNDLNVTFRIP
jgi:hypothetical protein